MSTIEPKITDTTVKSKKYSKYVKKEKPDYRKWIEIHRNEILLLDPVSI